MEVTSPLRLPQSHRLEGPLAAKGQILVAGRQEEDLEGILRVRL